MCYVHDFFLLPWRFMYDVLLPKNNFAHGLFFAYMQVKLISVKNKIFQCVHPHGSWDQGVTGGPPASHAEG